MNRRESLKALIFLAVASCARRLPAPTMDDDGLRFIQEPTDPGSIQAIDDDGLFFVQESVKPDRPGWWIRMRNKLDEREIFILQSPMSEGIARECVTSLNRIADAWRGAIPSEEGRFDGATVSFTLASFEGCTWEQVHNE